jgi:hypothetical protein
LECGHSCTGSCSDCAKDDEGIVRHISCRRKCDRPYSTCNHRCVKLCHNGTSDCGTCEARCEVSC